VRIFPNAKFSGKSTNTARTVDALAKRWVDLYRRHTQHVLLDLRQADGIKGVHELNEIFGCLATEQRVAVAS
jgi:hypothetical protein